MGFLITARGVGLLVPFIASTDTVMEMAMLLLVDGECPDYPFNLTDSTPVGKGRGNSLLLDGGGTIDSHVVSSDTIWGGGSFHVGMDACPDLLLGFLRHPPWWDVGALCYSPE